MSVKLETCFTCGRTARTWHLVFDPSSGTYRPAVERMDNGRLVIEQLGTPKRTWQEADLHLMELRLELLQQDMRAARELKGEIT